MNTNPDAKHPSVATLQAEELKSKPLPASPAADEVKAETVQADQQSQKIPSFEELRAARAKAISDVNRVTRMVRMLDSLLANDAKAMTDRELADALISVVCPHFGTDSIESALLVKAAARLVFPAPVRARFDHPVQDGESAPQKDCSNCKYQQPGSEVMNPHGCDKWEAV